MPSSVRTRKVTIGFFAFGFSEKPASGSSFGNCDDAGLDRGDFHAATR